MENSVEHLSVDYLLDKAEITMRRSRPDNQERLGEAVARILGKTKLRFFSYDDNRHLIEPRPKNSFRQKMAECDVRVSQVPAYRGGIRQDRKPLPHLPRISRYHNTDIRLYRKIRT